MQSPNMQSNESYSLTTNAITITVQPFFLEDQSEPEENRYFWAYHVHIENNGNATAQLLTRHWRIVDARGSAHDVIGDGVVGEQPVLAPGEAFEYTSGTPLSTPSGIMAGTYQMQAASGEAFDAVVPAFSLDSPHEARRVN